MHGREAICPLDVILPTPVEEGRVRVTDFVAELQRRFEQAFSCVLQQQRTRTERMKRAYDANVSVRKFKVGDIVWYYYPRTPTGRAAKWRRFCTGPFRVERIVNDVNYVIRRSPRSKPIIVHVDKLKLYHGPAPACWEGAFEAAPPSQ